MSQSIIYICSNCNRNIPKKISDMANAEGSGGICPHCATKDDPAKYFKIFRQKHVK